MIKKYFKNGNVNIRLDMFDFYENTNKDTIALYNLYQDCLFLDGGYDCWGYDYPIKIYDLYSGLCYIFNKKDAKRFFDGKTVKLYGQKPDEYDFEYLKDEHGFIME